MKEETTGVYAIYSMTTTDLQYHIGVFQQEWNNVNAIRSSEFNDGRADYVIICNGKK